MKSNLFTHFKTDRQIEKEGIWMALENTPISFRVKRFGGENADLIKAKTAKLMKPYAHQQKAGVLPSDVEEKIAIQVFVEECIVDWKGLEIDGKPAGPYNPDLALKLFADAPEAVKLLIAEANNYRNFLEFEREALGNS